MFSRILVTTITLAALTSTAWAQRPSYVARGLSTNIGVGVGVGSPWTYYGLPYGPYAFGFPGAAGTQWSNGHSLYGPPIPTYGPTPGAFGGGDAHRGHQTFGFLGTFNPSPRFGFNSVSVYSANSPRMELTGPSVDAIAPNEVPRPASSRVKWGLFKRR